MARRLLAIVALGVLVFGAPACGGGDENGGGGGGVDVNVNPSGVVVTSGSATVQVGGGAEIPSGFPSSFPLPDGAAPVYSMSAGGSYSLWFSTPQSFDELKGFFDSELPGNGWTVTSKADFSDSTGAYSMYAMSGNGFDGSLIVGEGGMGAGFSGDFSFFVSLTPAA